MAEQPVDFGLVARLSAVAFNIHAAGYRVS